MTGLRTQPSSLAQLVRTHADTQGDRVALTFLTDPADNLRESLTYAQLDRDARRIGSWLTERGARGERVLLLHPPGLEFAKGLVGCAYAGAVAVPSPLPGTRPQHRRRVTSIARDSGAAFVLTDAASHAEVTQWAADEGLDVLCAATDSPALGDPRWRPRTLRPDELALLQYTSGSTSDPKGVMISHANLVHNAASIGKTLGSSADTRFGGWLPHYHDLGLMGMLLQPLFHGGSSVFMSPMSFLKRPHLWLDLIDRHGVQMSGGPNFAYELCARRLTEEQIGRLDLSRWLVAVNGAEPIRARSVAAFLRRLEPAGLRAETMFPCYGLAEATLIVCGDRPWRPPLTLSVPADDLEQGRFVPSAPPPAERPGPPAVREFVSSGVVTGLDVLIVDPDTAQPLPPGRIGEIWARAGNVGLGYWGREDESRAAFRATTAGGETGYLRTGDLGAVHDGELFVTGRIKDLLIVHGRNLHPQDIEADSKSVHPALAEGAAAAFGDDQRVVVVQEARAGRLGPRELDEIARAVSQHLGRQYGIGGTRVLLVRPGGVQRTTSGKVQRSAMRELYLADEIAAVGDTARAVSTS
ncbi:fatty acyl-AMP ligase [Streptomyces sp. MK7]|uniref:fatty acyl-AMP ligase n=1 Tax=Streptomyces sp. MK7 TaxID=3067635 RepID=UPI00292EE7C2|nr:fatty acyl-AMP ligase [Streptomyces sp. MK7]